MKITLTLDDMKTAKAKVKKARIKQKVYDKL